MLSVTVTLSITVWLPRWRNTERIFCASSGRTKFSAKIRLTVSTPASIIDWSSELQYCPSKNSKTYTGTFAPSLIFLVKSLRTILPSKYCLSFWRITVLLSLASKKSCIYSASTSNIKNQNHQ